MATCCILVFEGLYQILLRHHFRSPWLHLSLIPAAAMTTSSAQVQTHFLQVQPDGQSCAMDTLSSGLALFC